MTVSGLNGNALGSNNDLSNQDNDYSQANGNSVLSDNALGSDNTTLTNSQNNNSDQNNDYSDNSGQDSSLHVNVRVNLTDQTLSSNVSDVSFNGADNAGADNRAISSGDLSYGGGAFQGWAGIQTASTNTGIAANNLATTAVSANANVSFGAP